MLFLLHTRRGERATCRICSFIAPERLGIVDDVVEQKTGASRAVCSIHMEPNRARWREV